MSNLLVQNIKHTNNTTAQTIDTSGRTTIEILNTGSKYKSDGGAVTQDLVQVIGKHWCRFTGTGTIAIQDSINASSLTDAGTGDYEVIFTNNFSNADYACVMGTSGDGVRVFTQATSKIDRIIGIANDGSVEDGGYYNSQIDGDLA